MKISSRKKAEESFKRYIHDCDYFSEQEKIKIFNTFEHGQIKVIFTLTMYLFLWSFCAAFVDTFLVTRGVYFTVGSHEFLGHFLPTLIFLIINALLKFIFIYFYLRGRIRVKIYHILVGVIPLVGSLFITAVLLKKQKLFFRALKKYLKYRKKKRLEVFTHIK